MVYAVMKQVTWSANLYLIRLENSPAIGLRQSSGAEPQLVLQGDGAALATNSNLALDTWGIVRFLYNGANSSLQINETAATTGDTGTTGVDRFEFFSSAPVRVKEVIYRHKADSEADQQLIYDYLETKYGL